MLYATVSERTGTPDLYFRLFPVGLPRQRPPIFGQLPTFPHSDCLREEPCLFRLEMTLPAWTDGPRQIGVRAQAGLAALAVHRQRVADNRLDDEPVQHGAGHRVIVEPGRQPYSPIVPSLTRWMSGLVSAIANSRFRFPTTLVRWVYTACARSIIEYGAARCSAKWTTAPGSADHTSVAAACGHHAQNAARTLATLAPSSA